MLLVSHHRRAFSYALNVFTILLLKPTFLYRLKLGRFVEVEVKGEVCHKIVYTYPIPVRAYNLFALLTTLAH